MDGSKRDVLEMEIPTDADPGLVYNSQHSENDERKVKYEFDKVFDINATQDDVFATVARDRIRDTLYEGINCSLLAYGQVSEPISLLLTIIITIT